MTRGCHDWGGSHQCPHWEIRVLLILVANSNKQDITLIQRTILGHLQSFRTTAEQINIGERKTNVKKVTQYQLKCNDNTMRMTQAQFLFWSSTSLCTTPPQQRKPTSQFQSCYIRMSKNIYRTWNQGLMAQLQLLYTTLVVWVRKKDGTLKLCCDTRGNKKSVPDCQPISWIQGKLYSHFHLLVLSAGIREGLPSRILDHDSQPLSALITLWGLYY